MLDLVAKCSGVLIEDGTFITKIRILSTAGGRWIGVMEYRLCEGGHLEGSTESVTEIGEGTYAQLLRCLHERCKDVHRMDASLATAV
jgi:hypothetical protein